VRLWGRRDVSVGLLIDVRGIDSRSTGPRNIDGQSNVNTYRDIVSFGPIFELIAADDGGGFRNERGKAARETWKQQLQCFFSIARR
jgi:hypothetical protein